MAEASKTPPTSPMTADAFMEWYDAQPEGSRYELHDGRVYPNDMQGERAAHARVKLRIASALALDIQARKSPCEAFVDGMAVRVDDLTNYEPDVFVRCGPPISDETIVVLDPVLVIEVVSPSSQRLDALTKLGAYFRNPAIQHYLIVIPSARQAIHHRRDAGERIETTIHHEGRIAFDPPGLTLDLAEVFEAAGGGGVHG